MSPDTRRRSLARMATVPVAVLAVAGCGQWANDLACHDGNCAFTREEWSRIQALSPLPDPPDDPSNECLPVERPGGAIKAGAANDPVVRLGWALYYDPDLSGPP